MNRGLRKRKETLRKKIIEHHILYEYDGLRHKQFPVTVHIYNTEHYILSLLQKRGKYVSWGFLQALKQFVWEKETTRHFDDLEFWNANLSQNNTNNIEKLKPIDPVTQPNTLTGV